MVNTRSYLSSMICNRFRAPFINYPYSRLSIAKDQTHIHKLKEDLSNQSKLLHFKFFFEIDQKVKLK